MRRAIQAIIAIAGNAEFIQSSVSPPSATALRSCRYGIPRARGAKGCTKEIEASSYHSRQAGDTFAAARPRASVPSGWRAASVCGRIPSEFSPISRCPAARRGRCKLFAHQRRYGRVIGGLRPVPERRRPGRTTSARGRLPSALVSPGGRPARHFNGSLRAMARHYSSFLLRRWRPGRDGFPVRDRAHPVGKRATLASPAEVRAWIGEHARPTGAEVARATCNPDDQCVAGDNRGRSVRVAIC